MRNSSPVRLYVFGRFLGLLVLQTGALQRLPYDFQDCPLWRSLGFIVSVWVGPSLQFQCFRGYIYRSNVFIMWTYRMGQVMYFAILVQT